VFATDFAARLIASPERRRELIPCTPSGGSDTACFEQVAARLTTRAFRRPSRAGEAESYLPLLALANEPSAPLGAASSPFELAVSLLVQSVLQDPEFLYRIEAGLELNDHEIATRLSYLLWGSAPDDALRARAEAGELRVAAGRRRAAEAMLDDPRARDQLHRFHAMWLGYRAIPHGAELAASFARETNGLLDRIVFDEPQSYLNTFEFPESYLDDRLADHYGLPHPSGGSGWVPYGTSGRAGILSHGSVLSAFGKFSDTSPTQRGIFVRTRLLCEKLSPPPPSVMADQPPLGDQDAVCKYDRYREHRTSSSCAACHSLTDSIGFGLENYDLAGRFREHDDGLSQCAIEGNGELVGVGSFSGPKELGALLVDRGLIEACVVKQYLQFALGYEPASADAAALEQLVSTFRASDHSLRELILSHVASEAFGRRSEPETP
jgi:hypothetical protein